MKIKLAFTISLIIVFFSQCKKEETNDSPLDTNNTPIIVHIDDFIIRATETDTILLQAVDKDGEKLSISLLEDFGFLTLLESTHSGNTTSALLVIQPGEEILGEFHPNIIVKNESGGESQTSFKIEVIEAFTYTIDDNIVKTIEIYFANTSEFEVESAYLGKSNYNSPYIYGLVKLHYIGNESRAFIKLNAVFKDEEGNELFTDESYLKQETVIGLHSFNTNSFVSPSYNLGYYKIIEDLDGYNLNLSDIFSVEIEITSSSYEYQSPYGHLAKINEAYQISDDSWYQNIENDESTSIKIGFNTFILKDHLDREYKWSFPNIFKWDEDQQEYLELDYGSNLSYGDNGYLESLKVSPDYWESNPLKLSNILMDWDVSGKRTNSLLEEEKLSALKLELSCSGLSIDKKNLLIKNYMDQIFSLRYKN